MAALDYLKLGDVEITNSARTTAYMINGLRPRTMVVRECGCPNLREMLGDDPYTRPEADLPVWVDPLVPESFEFGGLLVTEIEGLDVAPRTRVTTERIGDGAVIGRSRLGARTITVTGLLVGSSCCGIDYGLRWLAAALDDPTRCSTPTQCGTSRECGGADLVYLTCCPDCEDATTPAEYAACAAPYWRTLRDVALVDGPTPTDYVGGGCGECASCPAREVQFTLIAGRPHALREAVVVTQGETWLPTDPETPCVTWSNDPACEPEGAECTEVEVSCIDAALAEIGCAATPPPELPVPINPCACEPLTRRRHCITIPASASATRWSDAVTDLEVYSGSLSLKSVRIRFFPNPMGLPYDDLDPCGFCAEMNIATVPVQSTVRVDTTRRRVTVICPGFEPVPAAGAVTGTSGGPFTWPTLQCGVPYLMCVEANAATIAPDAAITVRVHTREA